MLYPSRALSPESSQRFYDSLNKNLKPDLELEVQIHQLDSLSNASNASLQKSPQDSRTVVNKPQYGTFLHVPGQSQAGRHVISSAVGMKQAGLNLKIPGSPSSISIKSRGSSRGSTSEEECQNHDEKGVYLFYKAAVLP